MGFSGSLLFDSTSIQLSGFHAGTNMNSMATLSFILIIDMVGLLRLYRPCWTCYAGSFGPTGPADPPCSTSFAVHFFVGYFWSQEKTVGR